MNPIAALLEHRSAESIAEQLTAAVGKEIPPARVREYARPSRTDKIPTAWAAALGFHGPEDPAPRVGLDADPPGSSPDPAGGGRRQEQPPRKPEDAKTAPAAPAQEMVIAGVARQRIAELHVFAGSAIATAVDADGFQADAGPGGGIALLWKDKADPIAEAWVKWAAEGNRFAQSFVRLMATGGAGGELVLGYAALLGGTAYLLGHLPDNEATRFAYGRYSRYRPPDTAAERGEPGSNGQAPAGSGDPLGAATGASRD